MRGLWISASVLACSTALACGTLGCAAPGSSGGCTATPFISPETATLDHTVPGNSQQFETGYRYAGDCAIPNVIPDYVWTVSDSADATATGSGLIGAVTCKNAAPGPVIVSTTLATYPSGSGPTTPPTYVPSGLPSATLTCK